MNNIKIFPRFRTLAVAACSLALSGCFLQNTRPVEADQREWLKGPLQPAPAPVAELPPARPLAPPPAVVTITTPTRAALLALTQPPRPEPQPPATIAVGPLFAEENPFFNPFGIDALEDPFLGLFDTDEGTGGAEQNDLWARIRQKLQLPDRDHPGIQADLNWYLDNTDYLLRVSHRARPYLHFIVQEIEARQMPVDLALLPIVESAFLPSAYSRAHAAGIWQFIPSTAQLYGLKRNAWYDGRRDIYASTRAALDFLKNLEQRFNGDWLLALAAYNSGAGTVARAIRKNEEQGLPTDFWSLDLPRETEGYVPKLLALANIIADPLTVGLELPTIPDAPFFEKVDAGAQIDLALVAEMTDLPPAEVALLNPGYSRGVTAPNGPHFLLLPKDKIGVFLERLAALTPDERVQIQRHRIRRGENLKQIAMIYGVTVDDLRQANKLHNDQIRAGAELVIPGKPRESMAVAANTAAQDEAAPRREDKLSYTVRRGDSLWSIARRHKVSAGDLASWNDLNVKRPVKIGQELVIHKKGEPNRVATAAKSREKLAAKEASSKRIRYKVRSGDSLARISERFKVSIADLVGWNDLNPKRHLKPGQALTLYVAATERNERLQ